jgi:hypothetical protein
MITLAESFFCVVFPLFAAQGGQGVPLVEQGRSLHQIVLNANASPSEWHAALECQTTFSQCTGVTLPVVEGSPKAGTPMIVLGCGDIAAGLGVRPTAEQLGEQGFVLRTVPPHIVIAGSRQATRSTGCIAFSRPIWACGGMRPV